MEGWQIKIWQNPGWQIKIWQNPTGTCMAEAPSPFTRHYNNIVNRLYLKKKKKQPSIQAKLYPVVSV